MAKILVTGAAGFLGTHLVRACDKAGHTVRAAIHKSLPKESIPNVEYIKGDIRDVDFCNRAVDGVDAVFHSAAAIAQYYSDDEVIRSINIEGTNALLSAAAGHVGKFVFLSSIEVYGPGGDIKMPCAETTSLKPIAEYGRNKTDNEAKCLENHKKGLLDVTILRPPFISGPGQNEPFILGLLETIRTGGVVSFPGSASRRLAAVDVRDMADVCLRVMDNPARAGESFNVGIEKVPPIGEWLNALITHAGTNAQVRFRNIQVLLLIVRLMKLFGKKPPIEPQHLKELSKDFILDVSKIKRVLNWSPKYDMVQSMYDSYDYYVKEKAAS